MRLLIVDDDPFVCISLKTILSAEEGILVEGTGGSGEEAIELYERLRPDILLLDIQMKGIGGLEAGRRILKKDKEARILYLTTFSDNEYIVEALKMGARGYLIKQDTEAIPPALLAVMSGQSVFGSEIISRIPSLLQGGEEEALLDFHLTEKELSIVALVAEGLNNREIAERLLLGEGTVRNYLSVILEKCNLRDRTQLAVFYLNHCRSR